MGRGTRGDNNGPAPRRRTTEPRPPKLRRYYLDMTSKDFGTVWVKDAGEDSVMLGEVKVQATTSSDDRIRGAALVGALGALARGHELDD